MKIRTLDLICEEVLERLKLTTTMDLAEQVMAATDDVIAACKRLEERGLVAGRKVKSRTPNTFYYLWSWKGR